MQKTLNFSVTNSIIIYNQNFNFKIYSEELKADKSDFLKKESGILEIHVVLKLKELI